MNLTTFTGNLRSEFRWKIMARECIENYYGMCSNETGILQSHAVQSVRQRSNIEYRADCENGLCSRE